jgi:phosphoenolpyruvate phosphomutase
MSCSIGESLSRFGNRIRVLETHDNSTTDIIRNITSDDGKAQFHGQWVSGLTQTTILGVPDTELITPLTRAHLISATGTADAAKSPRELCIAFDADSGGPAEEIPALVTTLARKGVSMIIIEDKEVFEPGQKVNSLAASSASQVSILLVTLRRI